MRYEDAELLDMIIKTGRNLMSYLAGNRITTDIIQNDQTVQWTITTPLYNIGEKVYQLSDNFKDWYDDIPWARIAGMRHRLVHSYKKTNWSIVAQTILHDLPLFLDQVEKIRATM